MDIIIIICTKKIEKWWWYILKLEKESGNIKIIIAIVLIVLLIIFGVIFLKNPKTKNKEEIKKEPFEYFGLNSLDGKAGVIDKTGKILINTDYENIYIPNQSKDVSMCYKNDTDYIILNKDGNELFTEYDVKAILRVGSAGSYSASLNVNDLFLADSSYTESNYANSYSGSSDKIVYSSVELNDIIKETAKEMNYDLKTGRTYSTEAFYTESIDMDSLVNEKSCSCEEMETFSLFLNARHNKKLASALLTISDSFVTKEALSSEERVKNFDKMITLALESIIKLK